jgi:hypothetical protein
LIDPTRQAALRQRKSEFPHLGADRAHAKAFVKDSAITSKIKTRLAAEHITILLAMLESPHFCRKKSARCPPSLRHRRLH